MPRQRVETEWILTAEQFMQEAKKLDKTLTDLRKKSYDANVEAEKITKAFDQLSTPLKKLNGELQQIDKSNEDFAIMNRTIKQLNKDFNEVARLIRDTRELSRNLSNSLKDVNSSIDLSTFGRLEEIIKNVEKIEVFEQRNIENTKNAIDEIDRKLRDLPVEINVRLVEELQLKNDELKSNITNDNTYKNDLDELKDILGDLIRKTDNNFSKVLEKMVNETVDVKTGGMGGFLTGAGGASIIAAANQLSNATDKLNNAADTISNAAQLIEKSSDNIEDSSKDVQEVEIHHEGINFEELNEFLENYIQSTMAAAQQLIEETLKLSDQASIIVDTSDSIRQEIELLKQLHEENDGGIIDTSKINELKELTDDAKLSQDELEESIKNTDKALHGLSETNRKIIDLNSEEINQRYRQSRITQEMIDENEKLAIIINETEKATKEHTESVKDNNKEVESSTGVFQSLISALGQTKLGGALRNISGEFSGIKEQINGVTQAIGSSGGGGSGGGTATASGGGAAAGGGLVAALGWVAIAITAVVVAVKLLKAGFEKLISIMDRALSVSTEYENAVVNFASKTKAAQEEIVEFDRALRNAFKTQGFTDNVEYLGDVLTKVQMLLKLTGDEASQMAKDIVMVSEITGYSADEIIKTQQRIVANYRNYPEELQVDAAGALDVILSTYQQTLDINNDMLSTFTRYATEVNKMQLSMEYFYALLITGSKSGARSLTHVGDTIREIYSRITEGSDKVLEAFDQLDISYANTVRAFNTGGREAELALNTIINAIVEVSDKAEQHNIIDSLMGRRGKTVGIEFFNAIAEAEEEINRFEGSVLDAHQRITSGLSYQTGQIKAEVQNFLTSLWDEVGSVLTPLIAEFYADVEEHMWVLEDVIQEKIVPAFENLASTIFVAFNLDQFNDAGELLSAIADIIVILIDGASRLIIAFRGIYHTVAIIFNLFQMLHEALMIIIDTISLAIFHNNDNIVQNIAATFENILKLAGNLGIGIVNIFIGVFKSIYNHFVDKTLNKMLNAYNATIAKIPGIKEIQLMATYDEEEMFKTFDYLEMKPLKNDFKEKGFAATMSDFFEKQGKRFEKITKDWNDLQYHWDQLTTDDLQNRIDETNEHLIELVEQGRISIEEANEAKLEVEKLFQEISKDVAEGSDKALGDGELTKDKLLAMLRDRLQWQREAERSIMRMEERIAKQRWDNQEETQALLEEQYNFYGNLRDKYILTADEIMDTYEKQFNIAIKLKEGGLKDYKVILDKELQLEKDSNNKKIREQQRLIESYRKELDALNERYREEDYGQELSKLNAEIAKYSKASSHEGIAHYKDLLAQRDRIMKDHERELERNAIQGKIDDAQEEIKNLENKNNEIELTYKEMYESLSGLVNDREGMLQELREQLANTTNENIKAGLNNLVESYEDAYKKIQNSMLTMEGYQSARIEEAKRMRSQGEQLEDEKMISQADYIIEHANEQIKNNRSSAPDVDINIDEPKPNSLSAPFQIGRGKGDLFNKSVDTSRIDRLEKSLVLLDNPAPNLSLLDKAASNSVNNYTTNINFYGGIHNSSNADIDKFMQNMNSLTRSRNRSSGTR